MLWSLSFTCGPTCTITHTPKLFYINKLQTQVIPPKKKRELEFKC